jgi:hypothetical protein
MFQLQKLIIKNIVQNSFSLNFGSKIEQKRARDTDKMYWAMKIDVINFFNHLNLTLAQCRHCSYKSVDTSKHKAQMVKHIADKHPEEQKKPLEKVAKLFHHNVSFISKNKKY